ncbi:hypothetical protein Trydic_g14561 [Trypoxylus dichotomus]
MITDAFVHLKARTFNHPQYWTNHSIAMINSGVIRHGIMPRREKHYNITYADVRKALPYDNNLVTITVSGKIVLQMLEHSISWSNTSHKGEFLQFSGVRVVYDYSQQVGQRVVRVRVRCARCSVPKYEDLDEKAMYNILTLDFLAQGGDGFWMLKNSRIDRSFVDETDFYILLDYLRFHKVVSPAVDERIIVLNDKRNESRSSKGR